MKRVITWIALAAMASQTMVTPILAQEAKIDPQSASPTHSRATAVLPITSLVPRGLEAPIDPDTYVIGPSDEFVLVIGISRGNEYRFRVLPEGIVMLPNAGAMKVSGMTITEFRAALAKSLGNYYRNTEIQCHLTVPRSFTVNVLGNVNRPGPVEVYAPFRLQSAIASAGGISEVGSYRSIEIRSDDGSKELADIQKFLLSGDPSGNPTLHEGLEVFVPAFGPSVAVTGAVWRSDVYEVLPGESVADMIALAGGTRTTADLNKVVLERINEDETLNVFDVDPGKLESTLLQDRDVIVVPDGPSFLPRARIRIDANSGRDGYVYLQEGETIGTLMRRIGRFEPEHDLSSTVIERIGDDGKLEYIHIDVQAIIDDNAPNDFVLKAGDEISIPRRIDVVFVMGDVVEPKGVAFQRGLPASRYVALAGGPNSEGSADRLDIYSRDGTVKRSGNRASTIYRGETIIVKQRKSVIFSKYFFGLTTLTSLALSIVAVSR